MEGTGHEDRSGGPRHGLGLRERVRKHRYGARDVQARVLLVGILADKDWAGMLPPLLDWADVALLTVPETAPEGRRWQPEAAIVGLSRHPRLDIARAVPVFADALAQAEAMAGAAGTVLVTGSFHTVGDALARLDLARWGVDPPLPRSSSGV
jgi:folylpolyglutamate synthase/dihydropteroate synthase